MDTTNLLGYIVILLLGILIGILWERKQIYEAIEAEKIMTAAWKSNYERVMKSYEQFSEIVLNDQIDQSDKHLDEIKKRIVALQSRDR